MSACSLNFIAPTERNISALWMSFQDFNLYRLEADNRVYIDRIMNKTVLNVKNSVNREKFLSTLPLSTGHTLKFKHIIDVDI